MLIEHTVVPFLDCGRFLVHMGCAPAAVHTLFAVEELLAIVNEWEFALVHLGGIDRVHCCMAQHGSMVSKKLLVIELLDILDTAIQVHIELSVSSGIGISVIHMTNLLSQFGNGT